MTPPPHDIPTDSKALEQSEEAYADLVNLYPNNTGYLRQYAEILLATGKTSTATEILKRLHEVLEKESPSQAAELTRKFPQIGRITHRENNINDDTTMGKLLRKSLGRVWLTFNQRTLKEGEHLYRAGTEGDSLSLVLSGEIAVFVTHDNGQHVIVNIIGENNVVGEACFLRPGIRSSSVVANKKTTLIELPRNKLQSFLVDNPSAELDLEEKANFRHMARFLSANAILQTLPLDMRHHLAEESKLFNFSEKTLIRKAGEKTDVVDMLVRGKACYMLKDSEGKYRKLGNVQSGELMGDASAVRSSSCPADLLAISDVLMAHIPFSAFKNVVEAHPSLKEKLFQSSESQRLKIMHQVANISAAHQIK
ncbi:MAG: cyclic nucleotide-binding domain-containing protein [Mariprofundaceae bacterium]